MGNVHRSMQGKIIDMEKLMRQNELMPAIGNVRVNARGDELGPGGKIIKKKEDIMAEYYNSNASNTLKPVEPRPSDASKSVVDTSTLSRKAKAPNEG
jgi:hypothetical protein